MSDRSYGQGDCGCQNRTGATSTAQAYLQRIGPVMVATAGRCAVVARVGGLAFVLSGPATIRNVSRDTLLLSAQTMPARNGPFPNALVESPVSQQTIGPARLEPGAIMPLPAPPAGQQWVVVDINPRAIQRTAWIVGGLGAVALGGAAYGVTHMLRERGGRRRRR